MYASADAPYVSYSAFRNAVDKEDISEAYFFGPRTVAFKLKVPLPMPAVTQPPTGFEKIVRMVKGGGAQAPSADGDATAVPQERSIFRVSLPR